MNIRFINAYRPVFFLGLGCLFTGGLIVWECQLAALENLALKSKGIDAPVQAMVRLSTEKNALLPLGAYQDIVNKPLFFAGREEVAGTSTVQDDGTLKLTGIVLAPHGFLALIRDEHGTYYRLNKGTAVQGWTVARVEKDRVELVKNAESRELALFELNKSHDLTAEELENCFKNQADLPLDQCYDYPKKFAHKSIGLAT